jgi:hypothetical protein
MHIGRIRALYKRIVKQHGHQHAQQLDESESGREEAKIRDRQDPQINDQGQKGNERQTAVFDQAPPHGICRDSAVNGPAGIGQG